MSQPGVELQRRIDRLLGEFAAQPLHDAHFAELEQALRQTETWGALAGVYECRISALSDGAGGREELLLQLAELLESRLADPRAALDRYRQARRLQPLDARALSGIRRTLARLDRWSEALLVAEVEEQLPLEARPRAALLAHTGELWTRVFESEQARRCFEEALRLDPSCDAALAPLCELALAQGETDEAVRLCERRREVLSGAERAVATEVLAQLLPAWDLARRRELLREVVQEFPERDSALEKLLELERCAGQWDRVDQLELRVWERMEPCEARTSLALRAAEVQLEQADSVERALRWSERALHDAADDASIHRLREHIFRITAQPGGLLETLEALERSEGSDLERGLEIAGLHERSGRMDLAAGALRGLLVERPDEPRVLELLDRCLCALGQHADRLKVLERRIAVGTDKRERAGLEMERGELLASALGDPLAAERAFRRALGLWPGHRPALLRLSEHLSAAGRIDDLAALLSALAERSTGSEQAALLCDLGSLELDVRRSGAAAHAAYLAALAAQRDCASALQGLRAVAEHLGDRTIRLTACEHELGLDLEPGRARALFLEIVTGAEALGDLPRARRAALRWSDVERAAEPHRHLARISQRAGWLADEIAALESLAQLSEDVIERARSVERLGDLCLQRADPEALQRAREWYRAALELDPQSRVRPKLIDLFRRCADLPELARELRAELASGAVEREAELRLDLARALLELGDLASARQELERTLELDPAARDATNLLDALLADAGEHDVRVELLDRALGHEPDRTARRDIAMRLAPLLLEQRHDAEWALRVLRPLADPARTTSVESLYERALDLGAPREEAVRWLERREAHLDGPARVQLLLQLARLQQAEGRSRDAVESLRRAERLLPSAARDLARRPLLVLARDVREPELAVELLHDFITEAPDAAAEAAFRLERARLLIDELGRVDSGRRELEALPEAAPLQPAELELLAALARRAGPALQLLRALEGLSAVPLAPLERRACRLELADLYAEGPEQVRDAPRAERLLRELLQDPACADAACTRLERLVERAGRTRDLCELLRWRLGASALPPESRHVLVSRLARASLEIGDVARAIELLDAERAANPGRAEHDEILCRALELRGDLGAQKILFAERARALSGAERELWLRRWLRALECSGEPADARLAVVQELLGVASEDPELIAHWIALLRSLGRIGSLAHALEVQLDAAPLGSGQRRAAVRELLRLYDGPLQDAARALALVLRELPHDESLRMNGARYAAEIGDSTREIELLEPLVRGPEQSPPTLVRRLALLYWTLGHGEAARPLLWRALDVDSRDREVLAALGALTRRDEDRERLLALFEQRYRLESRKAQLGLAREAFALAEQLCERPAALRWIRRWGQHEPLGEDARARWLALERSNGDVRGVLLALRTAREASPDADARAELGAEEARLWAEIGHRQLARSAYENALAESSRPRPDWLQALERVVEADGDLARQLEILAELARHAHIDPIRRTDAALRRIELLRALPDRRAQAALELRSLLDEQLLDPELRTANLRSLLALHEQLGQTAAWIEVADTLSQRVPLEERAGLERERARRLESLGARAEAIDAWRRVLARDPQDLEASDRTLALLDRPGSEAERLELLERCAADGLRDPRVSWREAAALRWGVLRDAERALLDLERALAIDPVDAHAHALRAEVCAHLGRDADEIQSLRILVEGSDAANPARWLRLAQMLAQQSDGAQAAGEAASQSIAHSEPGAPQRIEARRVLERIGAWDGAARLLREEVEHAQGGARAAMLRHLARVLWDELARADDTCAALHSLAQIDAPDAQDRERWSQALSELGRWPEALEQRRMSLAALGSLVNARAWLELAQLSLDHGDDPAQARAACERAQACEPDSLDVLRLRIELHRRAGAVVEEIEDSIRLAERLPDGTDAARELSTAAARVRTDLDDPTRAWTLYRSALKREPGWLPALLGAGELAREKAQWADAERMFATAAGQLRELEAPEGTSQAHGAARLDREQLGYAARLAAEAALQQGRDPEALRYLDTALYALPTDPPTLELMASLGLRLGAYERARTCLETQLETSQLAREERVPVQLRLARACEGIGDLAAAARSLEWVLERRPHDEVSRAHAVDLLERLGEVDRALLHLDAWSQGSPPQLRAGLALRAARLETGVGRIDTARSRLEALLEDWPSPGAAWIELAALTEQAAGSEGALGVTERALQHVDAPLDRGALLWIQARALHQLGRIPDAMRLATEALEADPRNLEAGQLLAQHLGRAPDFRVAVQCLEHALDLAEPDPVASSELWEAVGRAYAGPLEDLPAAQRAYRRALDANPLRSGAREALADVTAFDPSAHIESLQLHRDLLEAHPGRRASWCALERIAAHWAREPALATCASVLRALGASAESDHNESDGILVRTSDPEHSSVAAATELVLALEEAGALPAPAPRQLPRRVPGAIRTALARLAGSAWELADDQIADLLREPPDAELGLADSVARRVRRRVRRADRVLEAESGRELSVEIWREELLAQAAACALNAGRSSMAEALHALLEQGALTQSLALRSGGDVSAAIQLCPPARVLLLRIADAVLEALPHD